MATIQAQQISSIYGARMHAMMHWLALAAREMRQDQDRKQVHIAASANLDQSTVNRFERGETHPQDLDGMVAAYADDLEIEPVAIWQRALELWQAAEAAPAAEPPATRGKLGRLAPKPQPTAQAQKRPQTPRARAARRGSGRS